MCDSATRPAFIPVPNVAKMTMSYLLNLQHVENVFHFEKDDPWTEAELSTLNSAAATSWIDNFRPSQPNSLKLETIESRALDAAEAPYSLQRVDDFGQLTSPSLPGNVTLSVKFSGGLTGRSRRGRMYWLQLTEDAVVGDQVQTIPLGSIIGGVEAFFEDIESVVTGAQHVVVSYCADNAWRTEGVTTQVTAYSSDGIVDSQRRRLTGRGR